MAVGLHAVNKSSIQPGEVALVIGSGPIGLSIIAALRLRGVESIVAADYSPKRRGLAATMGAHQTLDPALGSPFDEVKPSVVFEAVGVPGIINDVMNQTSDRMQAVINALTNSGIDRNDIATTNVTVQPQYSGSDNPNAIVGYQASNSINVKIRNLNNASQTLGLIGTTGGDATRINSVSYSIDDDSQLVKDARTRAFDDAKDRAEQYAQLSGLTLGKVISISESSGTTPPTPTPAPMPRAAMEAVPVEPGQQTIGFSVTVIWELT